MFNPSRVRLNSDVPALTRMNTPCSNYSAPSAQSGLPLLSLRPCACCHAAIPKDGNILGIARRHPPSSSTLSVRAWCLVAFDIRVMSQGFIGRGFTAGKSDFKAVKQLLGHPRPVRRLFRRGRFSVGSGNKESRSVLSHVRPDHLETLIFGPGSPSALPLFREARQSSRLLHWIPSIDAPLECPQIGTLSPASTYSGLPLLFRRWTEAERPRGEIQAYRTQNCRRK